MFRLCEAEYSLSVAILVSLMMNIPAWGQFQDDSHADTHAQNFSSFELLDFVVRPRDFIERTSASPATVSKNALMHPLSAKVRRRLAKAVHLAKLGDHPAAIKELRETLLKEPSSAPYAQNLLGVEYVQNQQFGEARHSFEEALRLMPHESVNHSNLGVSLAVAGDWNSADQEARKALELDPNNASAKALLDLAISRKPRTAKGTP